MKKRIIYAVFAVCVLIGAGFIIGTVSAQRAAAPKNDEVKTPKPTGGYTRDGKYFAGDGKPVEYTWCYPGTWVANPNYTNPQLYTCKGGSVYGSGELGGPGAPH